MREFISSFNFKSFLALLRWPFALAGVIICVQLEISQAAMCSEALSSKFDVDASVTDNDFITNRKIGEYYFWMGRAFMDVHRKLKPEQVWMDLGAGDGAAVQSYVLSLSGNSRWTPETEKAAKIFAFSFNFNKATSLPTFDGKITYVSGNFELLDPKKYPKADLITDMFGPISYAKDLHATLQNAFDLLKVRGQIFIHATNVMTQFKFDNNGTYVNLYDFLSLIPNLKISFDERRNTYRIVKLKADVKVPRFTFHSYFESTPPGRIFYLEKSPEQLRAEKNL